MTPNPSGDFSLSQCLDASVQKNGGKIELQTPAGPLTMTLPPGLVNGQTLRIPGRGELGPEGKRGDVLLTVSFFSVDGDPAGEEPAKETAEPSPKLEQAVPTDEVTALFDAMLKHQKVPPPPEPRVEPVQAQSAPPAVSPATTEADSAPMPEGPVWISGRGWIDFAIFASLSVLGMSLSADAKYADFPFYIALALVMPCVCLIVFVIESQFAPPDRLRIEALRILRIVLFSSWAIGLYGADKQDQWPFKDTSGHIYKRVIGEGYVRDYAAENNPINRRARAFEPLFAFFFWGLLIPFSPLILYAMLTEMGTLKNRDLHIFGLTLEQMELDRSSAPLEDPDFGRLEWKRDEHHWRGRVPCSFGGNFELTIERCLTAGAPPPSAEQRKELLAVLGRMNELRTEAARQFQIYLGDDDDLVFDDDESEEGEPPPPKPDPAPKPPTFSLEQIISSITPHSLKISGAADLISPTFATPLEKGYVILISITAEEVDYHFTYANVDLRST